MVEVARVYRRIGSHEYPEFDLCLEITMDQFGSKRRLKTLRYNKTSATLRKRCHQRIARVAELIQQNGDSLIVLQSSPTHAPKGSQLDQRLYRIGKTE